MSTQQWLKNRKVRLRVLISLRDDEEEIYGGELIYEAVDLCGGGGDLGSVT